MKKSFGKVFTALFLSLGLCFLGAITSAEAAVVKDGYYWVQMADSDIYVAPKNRSHSARIVLSNSRPYNSWHFKHLGGDVYKITAGDYVMDLSEGKNFNGVHIIAWKWHGGNNQRWKVIKVGKYYQFISVQTGQAVDLPNNKRVAGTGLQGYTRNNSMAQKFELIPKNQKGGGGDRR